MKFEFSYDTTLPMGFSAQAVTKGTTTVQVRLTGYYSSEDGDDLIRHLEGISSTILDRLPREERPLESQIDHLVAVIRGDKTATVYINELRLCALFRSKRAIKSGAPVTKDDIADIHEVRFDGIDLPADAAIVVILSVGWRKGIFFDFTPLDPAGSRSREAKPEVVLAEMYTHLAFQERLKITDEQWTELFRQRWFPFIGLPTRHLSSILNHAALKAPIDELLPDMWEEAIEVSVRLRAMIEKHEGTRLHRATLTKALEHFESKDYVSSTVMLFPRIEGIMRERMREEQPGARATQRNLADASVDDPLGRRHSLSLLLPERFREFIETVYFADFDPSDVKEVSRNTVSHGIAPESQMTLKAAFMGVLILDQILRLFSRTETENKE